MKISGRGDVEAVPLPNSFSLSRICIEPKYTVRVIPGRAMPSIARGRESISLRHTLFTEWLPFPRRVAHGSPGMTSGRDGRAG
jgi:hypothetical protein